METTKPRIVTLSHRHRRDNEPAMYVAKVPGDCLYYREEAVVQAVKAGVSLSYARLDFRLDLAGADLRGADFRSANLSNASFVGADLAGARFDDALLCAADFRGANLVGADFGDCIPGSIDGVYSGLSDDPLKPYFRLSRREIYANLAEEYRAENPDVPVVENLDRKILDAIEAGGTLDMSEWHTCETTHCRAGWAIHLAGEAGYRLETSGGALEAGIEIYLASTGRIPHFFAQHATALEDLRRRAADSGGVK